MRSNAQQTSQDIKELRAEVERLGQMVKKTARHATEDASNVIGLDTDELRQMAKTAGKSARRYISQKQRQANELYHDAEDTISDHPLRAVGLAALSGIVLGALLGRR